jgi:ElaB/YqjD/DUF883 family membrane-anchored ribosome-binding protein
MENEPEVIRQRMQETRTDLTEKLEALEQQVRGVASSVTDSVESVKEGVEETVAAVKDTVQETVGAVKDTVSDTVESAKSLLDVRGHVERYPWAMLGGSVGVGLLAGLFLRRRTFDRLGEAAESGARRLRGGQSPQPRPAAREPATAGNGAHGAPAGGLTENLLGSVKEGLTRVRDMALAALFETVQRVVVRELPEAAEAQVKAFVEDALAKLKEAVKPHQPAVAPERERGKRKEGRRETAFHPETGRPMSPGSW